MNGFHLIKKTNIICDYKVVLKQITNNFKTKHYLPPNTI